VKPKNFEEYWAGIPADKRLALERLSAQIKSIVPDAVEVISYGMPAFKYKGRVLVGFAAFTHHCSFILWSGSTLEAHRDAVAGYETSKSTVHFTLENPIPEELVRLLILERLHENEAARKPNRKK